MKIGGKKEFMKIERKKEKKLNAAAGAVISTRKSGVVKKDLAHH